MTRKEALHFLNLAHFFDHFFLLIFPSAAIAIASTWQTSYASALALGTPVYVMFAVGTLPAGWLGDRVDRMQLIVIFYFGCGVSSLIVAMASGSFTLMVGLGFLGLFSALYHPVGLAFVPDLAERSGRALAINGVFGNMGLAAAAAVTGVTADLFGWRTAFGVPGIVAIVIGSVLLLRLYRFGAPTPLSNENSVFEARQASRKTQIRVMTVICIAALFGGFVFNAATVSLPKFLDERLVGLNGDLSWIGASAGLIFAIAAFAQLPVGELMDRYGARRIMLSLLAIQIVLLVALSRMQGWAVLPVTLLLVTMIFAEIPITSWLLGRYIQSNLRSRAVSVEYVLSLGMGSAVVPVIAGMHAINIGFDFQFVLLAGLAAAVFAAAFFLPNRLATDLVSPAVAAE